MTKKYYEVVFEGNFDIICGMLEGFMLAKGKKWEWHPSRESGVDAETFTDIIKEWASLKTRLHHTIIEEEFYNSLQNDMKTRDDLRYIKSKYIKSTREIKGCSFRFNAEAYAKKYADEIKDIIAKGQQGIVIEGYAPEEVIDKSGKGVELYSPVHDYEFRCEGTAKGDFGSIISFRKILNDHPLIEVNHVKLEF